jgi:ribonucleoside-diphosphate reductase beta chain
MTIDPKIFNIAKTNYQNTPLFLGENNGLFDTINKQYPKIWNLYKQLKSRDWDELEFNFDTCMGDFKSCSLVVRDAMIKTLAWQWEADTVVSRTITTILGNFITSSELWALWQRISDNEVIHAATYSEIVKYSFEDPNEVMREVLEVKESITRLSVVSEVMSNVHEISHKYALGLVPNDQTTYEAVFMYVVALYVFERIQFVSSFAVTFTIVDSGIFMPIGLAVQKIFQDEYEIHVETDMEVLRIEMNTDRGRLAFKNNKVKIFNLITQVVNAELEWSDYNIPEGKEIPGLTNELLRKWVIYSSSSVYDFFKLEMPFTKSTHNPLPKMDTWMNIDDTQSSPQEARNPGYLLGMVLDDAGSDIFTMDV